MSHLKDTISLFNPSPITAAAGGPPVSSTVSSFATSSSSIPSSLSQIGLEKPTRVITTKPQVPISDMELRARVQWSQKLSAHFQVCYDRMAFADPQADTVLEALEAAYQKIFNMTHESFADRLPVYVVDQQAPGLLGRAIRPHFNSEQRSIYLVQTSSQHLFSELVRLVAHAMRGHRYARHYYLTPGWAMLEDSFSIFLNHRLSVVPDVFPFYGADADVIAHHLYDKHNCNVADSWLGGNLSIECIVLGGAFFIYLGDTFSDDRVVTFSKIDGAVSHDTFRDFYGATLHELESAWKAHLPASLRTVTHDEQEEMIFKWEKAIECKS